MARTNATDVDEILDTSISNLTPWVEAANSVVDRVASEDSNNDLSSGDLQRIEKFLAAYYATAQDPRAESMSGASRSESRYDVDGEGNASYKEVAEAIDTTGVVASAGLPTAKVSVPSVKDLDR